MHIAAQADYNQGVKNMLRHLLLILLALGFAAQVFANAAACHCPPAGQPQHHAPVGEAVHQHTADDTHSKAGKSSSPCHQGVPCCTALPAPAELQVLLEQTRPALQTPYLWSYAANYLGGLDRPPKPQQL